MKRSPRITVLCSVYNGAAHFDKAIPSILAQTLTDFALFVVDDGSDDGTSEFLAGVAAKDPRVTVFRVERLGLARAINHALAHVTSDYVARQDFDDISYPTRLERQVAFLDAHPEVGLVGSAYILDDHNRGERYVRRWPTDDASLRRAMSKAIPFAHTMVALRTEALRQVGGIAEVSNITDLRTWIRIARRGWKLANIPEVLGEHYVYAASYWHANFTYARRQRELARVQAHAIFALGLGWWRLVFPAGRLLYGSFPNWAKRLIRRVLAGSKEEDI